jgi:hypothetical protein
VITTEIEGETVLRNVVAAIAAAFVPSPMLGFPLQGALLLPGVVSLPSAALM